MKTMKWLLRREFWEHKGAFFWAPAVIAAVMLVFVGGGILYGIATGHMGDSIRFEHNGAVTTGEAVRALPRDTRAEAAAVLATHYLGFATPLFAVLPFVAFYYCLSALYDDRRDRSILFWKSLPVSDQTTVLSKVITAICVAPVITALIGTVASLLVLLAGLVTAALNGLNLFGLLFMNPNFYLAPIYLLGILPVYMLWALPTVGWLLMVSSWARSKVFLWAVGTPLIVVVLLKWFNFVVERFSEYAIDTHWFVQNIVARGLVGLIPGIWFPFTLNDPHALAAKGHGLDLGAVFTQSWLSLATPGVWLGALAGALMIVAAIRLRRWRDEG
jgi:ABC-2 type transport system permease protein